jgi:hypothetical protein
VRIDHLPPIVPVSQRDLPEERRALSMPEAEVRVRRRSKPMLAALFGFAKKPAVAAVMAGALLVGGTGFGAPLHAQEIPPTQTEAATPDRIQEALDELEARRNRGEITPDVFQRVRARLRSGVVPFEHDGDVDLDALINETDLDGAGTRGDRAFRRLAVELEHRMRVTARDMADPNTRFIDGAPGYKEISEDELRDLLVRALRDVPLEELPLGPGLARVMASLPLGSGITEKMSPNEIEEVLDANTQAWFDEKLKPLIEGREVEAAIVGFGTVTALRWASPGASKLIDRLDPRATIYETTSSDGRSNLEARLAWRELRVLPDLDLTATSTTSVGLIDLYGSIDSRIAPEADDVVTGFVSAGARYDGDTAWFDASISRHIDRDLSEVSLRTGGSYDGVSYVSSLVGARGEGTAIGDASGRVALELDLAKPVRLHGADGSFGMFVSVAADTDGTNEAVAAGLVFRLRF